VGAPRWTPPRLEGAVAIVTGSSRGVGKGVALALGDCGSTVYVTGRSSGVDETAAEVTARGGTGLAARTDHTDDPQVEALFERVAREQDRLDLVVANAWGGYEDHDHRTFGDPFWEQPASRWAAMVDAGLRASYMTAWLAARAMVPQRRGLIVFTAGWDEQAEYLGNLLYDVVKSATSRLVAGAARELRPHGVAAIGVYPGFTRTEAVVDAFAAGGMEPPEEAHSPELVGRAVAHALADPDVLELSGTGAQAAAYAERYGFTDVDGRRFAPFRIGPS
jgi:NAD(P)-dependent dehydrogenase (short-subunit alcohol dehydrogenase family)